MKYKAMLFDLDGTLVNTINALTYCTNLALAQFGLGPLTSDEMKRIVGDGYKKQMERSLIAAGDTDLQHYEEIQPVYLDIFDKDCTYELETYDGIRELIDFAKENGIKIAVVSNKPHAQTVKTIEYVFGKDCFDLILGQSEEMPKKPDPAIALAAAEKLGVTPDECLYFGDTDTDMRTGKNAKMTTVGVLWGFRDRDELERSEPQFIIEKPEEAEEICMS